MNRLLKCSITVILLIILSDISAQNKKLDKQLEVTRDYQPTVENAPKINFSPDSEEKVDLAPDFEYSIEPKPINYQLSLKEMESVNRLELVTEEKYSGMAKIGIGFPIQSVADAYYSSSLGNGFTYGGGFNHYGYYGKLDNEAGLKLPATQSNNSLFGFAKYLRNRFETSLKLGYKHDRYNRYGASPISNIKDIDLFKDGYRQRFNRLGATFQIGTSMSKISTSNAFFEVDYKSVFDRFNFSEGTTQLKGYVMGRLGHSMKNALALEVSYKNISSNFIPIGDMVDNYNSLNVSPTYKYSSDNWNLSLGVKINYILSGRTIYDKKEVYFYPIANITYKMANGAISPYIDLNGELKNNSYYNMTIQNPYLHEGSSAPISSYYRFKIGVKGDVGSVVSYNVNVGIDDVNNMVTYANTGKYGNIFTPLFGNYTTPNIEASIFVKASESVKLFGTWKYIKYQSKEDDKLLPNILDRNSDGIAVGMPNYTFEGGAIYTNKMFQMSLSAEYIGERFFVTEVTPPSLYDVYTNHIGGVIDISLKGSYNLTDRIGVFAELNNLANQKMYRYNYYRGIGFNAILGAKYIF